MKVVIITGGGRGIGASTAKICAANRWINAQDIEVAGGYII